MSNKVEYDSALNDAGWVMIHRLQELGPLNGAQFNYMKSALREAIQTYLDASSKPKINQKEENNEA